MLRRICMSLLVGLTVFPSVGIAGWRYEFRSSLQFQATHDSQTHPTGRTLLAVVPQDSPLGQDYCVSYSAWPRLERPNKARIRVRVEVVPVDPERELNPIGFGKRLKEGFAFVCSANEEPLQAGDLVVAKISFRRLPPLNRGEGFSVSFSSRGLPLQ